jgi:hypothetical protein
VHHSVNRYLLHHIHGDFSSRHPFGDISVDRPRDFRDILAEFRYRVREVGYFQSRDMKANSAGACR